MSTNSPFSLDRFEHERSHMYYLQKRIMASLENEKSSYIYGSRGTGKTTLLFSLNWKERLNNIELQQQLNNNPFKKKFIGIYMRVPCFSVNIIDDWLEGSPESVKACMVSCYFELIVLELLTEAIAELIDSSVICVDPEDEYLYCGRIIEEYEKVLPFIKNVNHVTLMGLSRAFLKMRRTLEDYAKKRECLSKIIDVLPVEQVGSFSNFVADNLSDLCKKSSKKDQAWYFKVCLDEAETLSLFNQKVINTLVRLATGHMAYVVSFVREIDDPTSTLIPNLTLQQADRNIINLDEMSENEFQQLAEGVATVRVKHFADDIEHSFSIEKIYSKLNINTLLVTILKKAESLFSKELLENAKKLANTDYYQDLKKNPQQNAYDVDLNNHDFPVYQAYLFDKLNLEVPSPDTPRWKRRSQESINIRKKMVAAYLCICKELKYTNPLYAFDQMLLGVSCKCIRDFLLFVDESFMVSKKSLKLFLDSKLDVELQNKAFRQASAKKFDSIPSSSGVSAPGKIGKMIDSLAKLTSYIQTNGPDNIALRSCERGIFSLNCKECTRNSEEILRLLVEAGEAGFLKIKSTKDDKFEFQVHHSLAPKYNFSYRGSYYKINLRFSDLEEVIFRENNDSAVRLIQKRLSGDGGDDRRSLLQADGD